MARKKRNRPSLDELTSDVQNSLEDETQDALDQIEDDVESSDATDAVNSSAPDMDPWEAYDASRDWRDDGPFDIDEVDLEADDIERIDLGCLILTPFEGMQVQLQVDERTQKIPAVLVSDGQSAIEVAVFAAPTELSTVAEVRRDMINATKARQGTATLVEGPFGTEIDRVIPAGKNKAGENQIMITRTWFVEGPRWLLRGILMGPAGQEQGVGEKTELLFEFFSNLVVVRGEEPRVPGELIMMSVPENLVVG